MGRLEQLAELDALQCIYPDCLSLLPPEEALIECLRSAPDPDSLGDDLGPLSYALVFSDIPTDDEASSTSTVIKLRVSLPRLYPSTPYHRGLTLTVASTSLPRDSLEELQQAVDEVIRQHRGEEVVVLAAEALRYRAAEVLPLQARRREEAQLQAQVKGPSSTNGGPRPFSLGRMLIWSHHIKNPGKKRSILEWARELQLGGASKPGFPGVIVAEGDTDHLDEFWRRIRALPWQQIQVRVRESLPPCATQAAMDAQRRLGAAFVELPEGGLGALGQRMAAAGLRAMFLEGLKIEADAGS